MMGWYLFWAAVGFVGGAVVVFNWALDEFDRMYQAGRRDEREGRPSLRDGWLK